MKESVVTYLTSEDKVCLGLKKFGYSKGKWNGFGGKIKPGETPEQAAAREVLEESEAVIQISDLKKVAIFYYHEPQGDWNVTVFLCNKFDGTPQESKEMRPEWFETDSLPLNDMWENDSLWLNKLFSGNKLLKGEFWHDKNGKVIKYELNEVSSL
jgi:8-oxo-dGTP diphosphatase/2-hydroxy-dATP diphosphatase